jgi:hypothetical protein
MPYHTVKPGDTLIGLAAKHGLKDWTVIANAPENAELKKVRPDPGMLKAGDKVFIPNREMRHEPSATDAKHTFKVSKPKAWLRVVVHDADGAPIASKPFQLTVAGTVVKKGDLPADGLLEVPVPVDAVEGRLTVWLTESQTETWDLRIGHMEPLDELSGVQARLNNLGFDCGDPTGVMNDKTAAAIRAFQQRVGLEVTGTVDDALKKKLKSYYDPATDERNEDAELQNDDGDDKKAS